MSSRRCELRGESHPKVRWSTEVCAPTPGLTRRPGRREAELAAELGRVVGAAGRVAAMVTWAVLSGANPIPKGGVRQAGDRVGEQVEVQCGDDHGDQEHQGSGDAAVDHIGHGVAGTGDQ